MECNCPPSQDTATGLPHAEGVHDAVIGDLLDLVVVPALVNKRIGVSQGSASRGEAGVAEEEETGGSGGTAAIPAPARADSAGEWESARMPHEGFEPAMKTAGACQINVAPYRRQVPRRGTQNRRTRFC